MGYASKALINRVTTTLLVGTFDRKRDLLRETPINPPHGHTNMDVVDERSPISILFDEEPHARAVQWSKLKIEDVADMVGFIEFGPVVRDQIGALTFDFKTARQLPTPGQRAGRVPCWFLPWQSGHIWKMKISSAATTPTLNFGGGIAPMPNPPLFFTAGINGCSVFAVGDTKNPSVYHGGFDPGSGLAMPYLPNETTEEAWRRLLGRQHTTKNVKSIGKGDYISELIGPGPNGGNRFTSKGFKTTRRADALEQLLQGKRDLTEVSVSPWGCVFGLRDSANDWKFTLVRNATVNYFRLTKKKRLFRSSKDVKHGESMPRMGVDNRQLGPGGTYDTDLIAAIADVVEAKITTCVNLGYKNFFPGTGADHYRDLASVLTY